MAGNTRDKVSNQLRDYKKSQVVRIDFDTLFEFFVFSLLILRTLL